MLRSRGARLCALTVTLSTVATDGHTQNQAVQLVEPDATVERVATGFGFLEGPVADTDGSLYFTDIPNQRIHRWTAKEGVTVFLEPTGGANGLRFDGDGNLLVCEMKNRRVVAINLNGELSVLADTFEGRRFNSPNDLWVDPKGGVYFSDPRYGSADDIEMRGHNVYYITPDRNEVRRVADDLVRPNGIIGTPDGDQLYIADHGAGRTYSYTTEADGSLTNKQLFAAQGSDGMTMDELGNVYLTGSDITIYNPNGEAIGSVAVPEPPANLTFGGLKGTKLFVTARTSLYSLQMTITGQ